VTREQLSGHRGIVHRVLQTLKVSGSEDAESEGMVALVEAADTFDPTRGAAFSTYAWTRISGHIKDWLSRTNRHARPFDVDVFQSETVGVPAEMDPDNDTERRLREVMMNASPALAAAAGRALNLMMLDEFKASAGPDVHRCRRGRIAKALAHLRRVAAAERTR
jgi:RNA polymerase sigma factor (sigma-70 family)